MKQMKEVYTMTMTIIIIIIIERTLLKCHK